jgi:hypothetical protein
MRVMNRLLICAVPLALMTVQAAAAPAAGWGKSMIPRFNAATAEGGAPLALVQYRRGGGANINRANVNRANVNRTNINRTNVNRTNFNSANFQRNVTVNRNVSVSGGNYGPNWGGVAAGVAVGAGVTAVAGAAARSAAYPPPPPYSYDPYYQYGY